MDYRNYDPRYNRYNQNRYSDHYHQQYAQEEGGDYKPRLTRSSSTGTNYYHYPDRDYVDYVQPIETRKKKRNKINRYVNIELDGEPMNDLEVIAAKNAAKNERKSKIVYLDDNLLPRNQQDSVLPLNSMMENLSVSSLDSTLVDQESIDKEEDKIKEDPHYMAKKKRWPFAHLFRKRGPMPTPSASTPPTPVLSPENYQSPQFSSPSISITPNPINSSNNTTPNPINSSNNTTPNPINSSNNTTPNPINSNNTTPLEEVEGSWAFTYPSLVPMIPPVWIKFDIDNQRKISDHVRSIFFPVVQFTDSHIGNNRLLVTVIPHQMVCIIPYLNQITRLQITYIPPNYII